MKDLTLKILILALAFAMVACQSKKTTPEVATEVKGAPIDAPAETPAPTAPGQKIAPTDPAERAALAADAPAPAEREGFKGVTFGELSGFPYELDQDGRALNEVPAEISSLHEQKVAVSGFLLPIDFRDDKVSSLILVRNQLLCCYGEEPKMNEWIFVNIDPPVDAVTEVPVTLFGTLYCEPDVENEQVINLYRMEATDLAKPS